MVARLARVPLNVAREWRAAWRAVAPGRSFARYAADVVLYRLLGLWRPPGADRERTIRMRDGVEVAYRLDRGDIGTIREVWVQEVYRPPVDVPVRTLVDLGTNIGLTSLWYAKRAGAARIVGAEPSPANLRLARRNLAANGVAADLVAAAVGPADGMARFERARDSNVGRVGTDGEEVAMVSVGTLLDRLGDGAQADLVKLDIEGGEAPLLEEGDLGWLDRVRALIVEFHLDRVDRGRLVRILEGRGFRYVPAGSARPDSMDFFVREPA